MLHSISMNDNVAKEISRDMKNLSSLFDVGMNKMQLVDDNNRKSVSLINDLKQ
jgi:hypothetical protein